MADLIGEKGVENLTQEVIHWAELVIKYSTNLNDALSAKHRLFDIYVRQKNCREVEKIVEEFPDGTYNIRRIIRAELKMKAKDREEERISRCFNIESLEHALGYETALLGNMYLNEEKYRDALYCYTFLRDMVESLYRDEKYRQPFVFDYYVLYSSRRIT